MRAEIIAIGTELLLGDTVNTNSAHISRALRDIGVDVFYHTTVGDNQQRTAAVIQTAMHRADVVITTGGLGPTVDDVTRQAVAAATGRPLELRLDLLEQLGDRFRRWGVAMSPNNRQQALVPAGSTVLENPVGTAPCFAVETDLSTVISLPGVPKEMTHVLEHQVIPYLRAKMDEDWVITTRVLRTAGIGESQIDAAISHLERLANPTVGLAAHAGQTDIRITAKARTADEATEMIGRLEGEVRSLLGENVFGTGEETVEKIVVKCVEHLDWTLSIAEAGTQGLAAQRWTIVPGAAGRLGLGVHHPDWSSLSSELGLTASVGDVLQERAQLAADAVRTAGRADVGLAVVAEPTSSGRPVLAFALSAAGVSKARIREYSGPPEYAVTWACTNAFDMLRRWLASQPG